MAQCFLQEGMCQVSLQRGQLALNLLETKVTTENTYADDRTHYVAFYSDAQGYVSWGRMGAEGPAALGPCSSCTTHAPQGAALCGR